MKELWYEFKLIVRAMLHAVPLWLLVLEAIAAAMMAITIMAAYTLHAPEGWPVPFTEDHAGWLIAVSVPSGTAAASYVAVYCIFKKWL